jgi:hypothetical protein
MILDLLPRLNQRKIVLASASPRRKELLEQMGLRFQVLQVKHPHLIFSTDNLLHTPTNQPFRLSLSLIITNTATTSIGNTKLI